MQTLSLANEPSQEFEPCLLPHQADLRPTAGNSERIVQLRPAGADHEIVATFGATELVRHGDGRWELRGSSPADHAVAREWSAHFPNEAPSQPLPATAGEPPSSFPTHHRILLADDDALVRGSLAAVLESEGFVVDEAETGIRAVMRAIEHPPDLVLLDLNMPHWDGWTAFSQLDRVTPLVPIIVITARPNQYPKAVQLGVDAFMEKPLNIPILVGAIKHLTSEAEQRHVRRITNRKFVTELLRGTAA